MNGETHLSMGAGHPPPSKVRSPSIFICQVVSINLSEVARAWAQVQRPETNF